MPQYLRRLQRPSNPTDLGVLQVHSSQHLLEAYSRLAPSDVFVIVSIQGYSQIGEGESAG